MSRIKLEICVDSVESAVAAERGGADRLELCANLIIGGTTPSMALFEQVRRYTDLPIRVLVRPRAGDFCYSFHEFEVLKEDVHKFREAGADAVVTGCLTAEGEVDIERMKELCAKAGDMDMTFHRAFDMVKDPYKAIEEIRSLGKVSTILTSGLAPDAERGLSTLQRLLEAGAPDIAIMPGSGVNADNIAFLRQKLNASVFHMSGKKSVDSDMLYRNPEVYMGTESKSEYVLWRTDEAEVRKAREALDAASDHT